MRFLLILLVSPFLLSCSSLIYENVRYSDVLKKGSTKAEIRNALGNPVNTGLTSSEYGAFYARKPYDKFHVAGPVYDKELADAAAKGSALSFGLIGIVTLPDAIERNSSNSRKSVSVIYDKDKKYLFHRVSYEDGDAPSLLPRDE